MKYVAGIDGSHAGWISVIRQIDKENYYKLVFSKDLSSLCNDRINLALIDMPVGLNKKIEPGGRVVDKLARKKLIKRKSSIFNAPSRLTLKAKNYLEANKINKKQGLGLSKQSWHLIPKIKEVEILMQQVNRPLIFESHPEIIFQEMNNKELNYSKKERSGIEERRKILLSNGFEIEFLNKYLQERNKNFKHDDFLDACAISWSALRVSKNININIPEKGVKDAKGILMQMKI
ncbi:MAG: DUF429 domain-containing protein [Pseudomonadota bacterium]|nr:DUF429 domain-containing protein [Pseudomonadota bacterium]MEC9382509.1 DUF429 domain-containing protein [Pseudomonadota bacterium]MEC9392748.1 DUF429 domain-containing protein [Pseudomonadota bacterium]MEC9459255.1 DUF429 domain-containing protein [Pseudomonadota bacterium]MED5437268.1 DUF429 domain-containing protein [Pseudomonadota bacterium]